MGCQIYLIVIFEMVLHSTIIALALQKGEIDLIYHDLGNFSMKWISKQS